MKIVYVKWFDAHRDNNNNAQYKSEIDDEKSIIYSAGVLIDERGDHIIFATEVFKSLSYKLDPRFRDIYKIPKVNVMELQYFDTKEEENAS